MVLYLKSELMHFQSLPCSPSK